MCKFIVNSNISIKLIFKFIKLLFYELWQKNKSILLKTGLS